MERQTPKYEAIQSLRLFGQACFGVVIGVLIALAVARLLLPSDGRPTTMPEGLLPWNLHNIFLKPREKGFYLLSLMLGGLCGYIATFRIVSARGVAVAIWVVLLASVPLCNHAIKQTLIGQSPDVRIFTIIFSVASLAGGAYFIFTVVFGRPLASMLKWPPHRMDNTGRPIWPFLYLLFALTLILIPSSFEAVAAKIGFNFHPVSFAFGPALYFLGRNLLPGIDYYSQYSIGFPWLFHFVMGYSAEQMVLRYTVIVILATWAFYAHLIYLLHWLYRSWTAAALMAFTPLILGFCHPIEFQAHFIGPSNTVLRYPLMTVCAVLCGYWSQAPRDPKRLLAIAAAAATSLFLETESGIVMIASASLVLFLVYPWRFSILGPIAIFLVATLISFVMEVYAAYGPSALQIAFFWRIFDAIGYFGASGFSGWPIDWSLGEWNWFYHLVAPGVLIATLAVVFRASGTEGDKRRAAVLGFLSASGLLLLFKYVNQSVTGVWQMSAIGPFSVIGWWCVTILNHIDGSALTQRFYFGLTSDLFGKRSVRSLVEFNTSLRGNLSVAMVAILIVFLITPSEARNPGVYGLAAWMEYPSLLKWPFARPSGCIRMDCIPNRPATSDITLIDSRVQPGDQVAILVDTYDWTYLIGANRPPLVAFLPSSDVFSFDQLEESLRRIVQQKYIFTTKGPNGAPSITHNDFKVAVEPLLGTIFQRDGEGERLIAWKRRASDANGAP